MNQSQSSDFDNSHARVPLHFRVRPNVEAAPWVVEEIKTLEREIERLQGVNAAHARGLERWGSLAGRLTVERDALRAHLERQVADAVQQQSMSPAPLVLVPADALAALRLAAKINPFGCPENAKARDDARAVLENWGVE